MTIISLDDLKRRVQSLTHIENTLDHDSVNLRFIEENNKLTIDDKVPIFIRHPSSPNPRLDQNLYRVTQDFPGFQEADISYYQYPPDGLTKQQRCNIPKNPVFYCSDVWAISLFEVLQGQNCVSDKIFYFSEWSVRANRQWKVLSFIFGGVPETNPAYIYIQQNQSNVVEQYGKLMSEKDIEHYLDFYHAEFTTAGNHIFSSIVSHQFLYDNGKGDYIFYPSVQAMKEGNNYAFNKNVIDSNELELSKVYKLHIRKLKKTSEISFKWNYNLLSIGEKIDGTLSFKKPNQLDCDNFKKHFPATEFEV